MAKRIITVLLALLGALLAVALAYVAYVMVTYERLRQSGARRGRAFGCRRGCAGRFR
ncbi:MAG: hypothetical protein ACLSDQ_07150 [Adlercreutzia equolifaciens]